MAKSNVTFTVNAIKSGYLVETRNGNRYIACRYDNFSKILVRTNSFLNLEFYDKKLNYNSCRDFDIVKIWGLANHPMCALKLDSAEYRNLLWERVESKKMTLSEIEAALGYPVEIVSGRDR